MATRDKKRVLANGKDGVISKSDPEWGGKCRESLAAAKAILNSPYLKNRSDHASCSGQTPLRESSEPAALIPPKALHGLLSPSPPREAKDVPSSNEYHAAKVENRKKSGAQPYSEDELMASIEQLIASHQKQSDTSTSDDLAHIKRGQVSEKQPSTTLVLHPCLNATPIPLTVAAQRTFIGM